MPAKSKATVKTSYDRIRSIQLVDFLNTPTERSFEASDLWKDKPTIVIVIRRPGCQFCREEATALNSHRDIFEKTMGMRMVCIVREKLGADLFQSEAWKGEVFFDPEAAFYKAMGGHNKLRVAHWETLVRPSFWKHFMRNKRSGISGNFIGDGSVLGGLLIVNNNGTIVYEHEEKVWGDIAPVENVLQAASKLTGVQVAPEAIKKAQEQFKAHRDKIDSGATCELPAKETQK
ncbi:hypothetical protein BGZ73_004454 [Actinomortierella ambigua]|nr:hypothetical protein BGZ73_004454 [Actinomortierella ambigua]